MATPALLEEQLLAPLDALRGRVLGLGAAGGRALFSDRDLRVAVFGSLSVLVALAFACRAPLMMLLWSPLILGIPHLVADARYLVARQGWHRHPRFWLLVVAPLTLVWWTPSLFVGVLGLGGAVLFARGSLARRVVALAGLAVAAFVSERWPALATAAFVHLHALVAIGVFVAWKRGASWRRLLPVVVLAACVVVLASGMADEAVLAGLRRGHDGRAMAHEMWRLAPGFAPKVAFRLVLVFAFLQSVHYAIWLRVIPEVARERAGMRSFRSSYRAVVGELGRPIVILALVAIVALLGWAAFDARHAVASYLRVSLIHSYIEIAAALIFFIEGRRPGEASR